MAVFCHLRSAMLPVVQSHDSMESGAIVSQTLCLKYCKIPVTRRYNSVLSELVPTFCVKMAADVD